MARATVKLVEKRHAKAGGKTAPAQGEYDPLIRAHYDSVAAKFGASPRSTMEDGVIRAKETDAILSFVAGIAADRQWSARDSAENALAIVDAGCGNGYTLKCLAERFPRYHFLGIEQNEKLRAIAKKQLEHTRARVVAGDIREPASLFAEHASADILICQRVLINQLDLNHQKQALRNVIELVKPGGAMIFIETFRSNLESLNAARAEFALEPIPPPMHNLPLPEDFFDQPEITRTDPSKFGFTENTLSTHYFVSRVLYPALLKSVNMELKRNSHFIQFFSKALPDGVGEYAPLKINTFVKRSRQG